jgi:hypothetical protein
LINDTKEIYQGSWYEKLPHGFGVIYTPTKDENTPNSGLETVNRGNTQAFSQQNNGQNGQGMYTQAPQQMATSSYIKYQGEIKNGMKNGYGVAIYPDGSHYQGQWVNNLPSGKGKLTNKVTDPKMPAEYYDGDWLDGQMNGKGLQSWKDNSNYNGEYFKGQKSGYGHFSWPDGNKYSGQYKNDLREGQGTFTW